MMTTLIILLILLALFAAPMWPYSANWGAFPAGFIVLVIIILLILGVPNIR